MSTLAKRIGKNLSRLRRKKGLTSERLAYEQGLSKGYLSDIENGKRLPSLKLLERLAKGLGVDVREFFNSYQVR